MAYTRFNIKGVPFRFKGAANVEDCETAQEVIRKANLDWEVKKCEMVAKMPFPVEGDDLSDDAFVKDGSLYRACPNAFATYRTDTNTPLGIVKDRYEEVQNIEAFQFFNDAIGKDKAIWQTAGFFGNGERIFVSAKLPNTISVKGDQIDNYLVFTTSHDGSSGVKILFTPIRVVCENTLNAAIRNSKQYVSFRHTQSVHSNIEAAKEILGICNNNAEILGEAFNQMVNTVITDKQAQEMFANVVLSPAEINKIKETGHTIEQIIYRSWKAIGDTEISTKKVNVLAAMNDYYFDGIGQKEFTGTAWGAYNAVNGYYSNVDNAEGIKRMDSLLYGSKAAKIAIASDFALNSMKQQYAI